MKTQKDHEDAVSLLRAVANYGVEPEINREAEELLAALGAGTCPDCNESSCARHYPRIDLVARRTVQDLHASYVKKAIDYHPDAACCGAYEALEVLAEKIDPRFRKDLAQARQAAWQAAHDEYLKSKEARGE